MKLFKKAIAVLMALMLLSGSFVCLAADGGKQYHSYNKVLLLGDSEASGYTDHTYRNTEFTFAPDSYSDFVSRDLGIELIPMACPGFRTVELRYMLDDNYRPEDKYLFNQIPNSPTHEVIARIPALRQEIAESDLIIIGIGGNDWGAYLGWVLADIQLANPLPEEFRTALREFLEKATFEDGIISEIVDTADKLNATDEVLAVLPEAVNYAFSSLRENWNYIIEYIYENNPDATVAVIGMFPTYYQTPKGEPENVAQPNALKMLVEDAIINYGNKHMVENQEKYGYIYVDTFGTIVEVSHPTVAGHRFIADRILEELPDARFTCTDVPVGSKNYKAIEYMCLNGLMTGKDEVTFGGDEKITKAELTGILNKLSSYKVSDSNSAVTMLNLRSALYKASADKSITDFFSYIIETLKLIVSGKGFTAVTRAQAAYEIYNGLIK